MSTKPSPETELDQPMVYHVRIKGHLGGQWADWFGGLTVTLEDSGESHLTGLVADQAARWLTRTLANRRGPCRSPSKGTTA